MWSVVLIFNVILISQAATEPQFTLSAVALPNSPDIPGNRIVGGSVASIERYPYAVQVLLNSRLVCGGSLITARHVLSAAHCFVDGNNLPVSPRLYSIRVGSATLLGGAAHAVSTIIVHERYNLPVRDNDVAVLLLSSTVTLSASVYPALIPMQNAVVPDNSSFTHIGWGSTNAAAQAVSSTLMEVGVLTVNLNVCASRYATLEMLTGQPFPVTTNMICAGLLDVGGKDACQGDSGGPLIFNGIVVGITSWGYGCGEPLFPGVNSRVASYTNWLNNTVTRYNAASPGGQFSAILLLATLISTKILY